MRSALVDSSGLILAALLVAGLLAPLGRALGSRGPRLLRGGHVALHELSSQRGELPGQFLELVGVDPSDEAGKGLGLLLLHVVLDAGHHHHQGGVETRLVGGQLFELSDGIARQLMLDLGFLGQIGIHLGRQQGVDVRLLQLHVHPEGGHELAHELGPFLVGPGTDAGE